MRGPLLINALVLVSACRLGFEFPVDLEDVSAEPSPDSSVASADSSEVGNEVFASCPPVDPETLALYAFDGDSDTLIADATGSHDGTLRSAAVPTLIPGPDGCGDALSFPEGESVYVEIPDDADWQLERGSIDLWVWPAPEGHPPPDVGIVGRDATQATEPGHFYLHQWTSTTPNIFVSRIQTTNDGGDGVFLCADGPVIVGQWTHIGINFGPPANEMWIDGELATNNDLITTNTGMYECNSGAARGIAGNFNPWGLGIDTGYSSDGAITPNRHPFAGGAIDHVRISAERRDFSIYRQP